MTKLIPTKLFSSLRVRLILLVLLATLPALLLTIYNGREQRQHAEVEALENALRLAEFAASQNEFLIEDTRVILISLSHAMNFGGEDLQGCSHILNHLKDVHFPFYSAFYVADLEGNILCSMPDGDLPEDLLGCHHYQSLIASDDFVLSKYHICRNTGKGVISMGYPIWDANNQKIGVINVGIDLMWFSDFALQAEMPPDSTLTVFDRDGVILAHYPDPGLWVGENMSEGSVHELVFDLKQGTTRSYDVDEVERLYAFLPLSGSEESVFLMLGIPTSYALANVEQTMNRNLILIGGVFLLTLLAAWFLSDAFVARQITNLVSTTHRIANGDLSARTPGSVHGEFGTLSQSINGMAEALSRREVERRQAEEEIRAYAANLERSNRDLLDFANITSHDLQEPLRKIANFSDLLMARHEAEFTPQALDYLSRIRASAVRMQNLIIDLLTYSRISTKAQPPSQVNLDEILQQVLNDLELQIEESDAVVNIGRLSNIDADPLQMQQLFLNLIGNSLKFRKSEAPVVIDIWGEQKRNQTPGLDGYTNYYEITVKDNGIGFSEKYLDRIFQPFQRLHPRDEYDGTGMGLAICRKIVERHHGEISVKSQPGKGASFTIRLPIFTK
jgi:signal transduction histidine kinase